MISPALAPSRPRRLRPPPAHVPLAVQTRDGLVESVHYGSAHRRRGRTAEPCFDAGEPRRRVLPALRPQAPAGRRHGPRRPRPSGRTPRPRRGQPLRRRRPPRRRRGASWTCTGWTDGDLENSTDLPYGTAEREEWLRAGGQAHPAGAELLRQARRDARHLRHQRLARPGLPRPRAPAAAARRRTPSTDLTGEDARAHQPPTAAAPRSSPSPCRPGPRRTAGSPRRQRGHRRGPRWPDAMRGHPEMVAGEGRDVTALMRAGARAARQGRLRGRPARRPAGRHAPSPSRSPTAATAPACRSPCRAPAPRSGSTPAARRARRSPVLGGGQPVGLLPAAELPRSADAA